MIKEGQKPEHLYWVALASSTQHQLPTMYLCVHFDEINSFYDKWSTKKRFMTKLADRSNIGLNAEVYDTLVSKQATVDEFLTMEAKLSEEKKVINGFDPAWRKYAGEEHQHTEFNGAAQ